MVYILIQLLVWRRQIEEGGLQSIQSEEGVIPKSQVKELERRVRELERILGRKTLENAILREAVQVLRSNLSLKRQGPQKRKGSPRIRRSGVLRSRESPIKGRPTGKEE